jgi:hypothetical protein
MPRLPLTQLLAIQPTQGHLCNVCGSCHRTATPSPHPASSRHKPCDPTTCPPLRSFPTRLDPVSVVLARPPAKPLDSTATVHQLDRPRLRLARLATMWPAPSPAVHRSREPSLLVSPSPGGPSRLKTFRARSSPTTTRTRPQPTPTH